MKLSVYNSLSRQLEDFIPLMSDPNYKGEKKTSVDIYSCGPTVYGDAHIGNLRAFWFADVLKSTIRYFLDLPVRHIMNITDVGHLTDDGDHGEDKMEKGSKREGLTARDISQKYGQRFMQFNAEFHNEAPEQYTWATKFIKEQIMLVKQLIDKGLTYEIPGDGIYMDTAKLSDYGKMLPPGHLEGLQDGARVEDHGKHSKTDFALWKFSPQHEQRQMEWIFDGDRSATVITDHNRSTLTDSEQSTRGFPGWHIECSAMSWATLGDNMDIHTGGMDHIPVHHTNEIAQSEYSFCTHKPWVKYWMHNQFLNIDGQKLSKSLGNAFTLPEIEAKGFGPLDLRMFFFTAQYSSFQDFSWDNLLRAKRYRYNLQKKLGGLQISNPGGSWADIVNSIGEKSTMAKFFYKAVEESLGSNLNTPQLLSCISVAIGALGENGSNKQDQEDVIRILEYLDRRLLKCDLFVALEKQDIPADIIALAEQRAQAKKDGDYALADQLRDDIIMAGFEIHDSKDGYTIL